MEPHLETLRGRVTEQVAADPAAEQRTLKPLCWRMPGHTELHRKAMSKLATQILGAATALRETCDLSGQRMHNFYRPPCV
jgi:hypothetical protein